MLVRDDTGIRGHGFDENVQIMSTAELTVATPWRTSSASPTGSSTTRRSPTASTASASRASPCRRSPQLADPSTHRPRATVGDADQHGPDARNLWRVHWYNDLAGGRVDVPDHVVLPTSLTGVDSPIIVVFGDRFPMITAHKVLAAYACLAPRVVTGQFDPTRHRAIWPSTGNYARGGIAISRIMASRGVAILPAGHEPGALRLARPVVREPGRRRHPHRRHREQRQGDLRRLQRAGEGSGELRAQPVLRVRQPPRATTRSPAGRSRTCSNTSARRVGRDLRLAAFTSRDRLGRHDRRRRPVEGRVRHEDRRRRGARVPDDARERLRRAQHPRHRRQAHPADPQRDEHRRRRGASAIGRPTSSTCCSTPTTVSDTSPTDGCVRRRCSHTLAHFGSRQHLQRARRDQDRQAARPRPRRRVDHGRHRRRGDVPERARQDHGARLRRRVHRPRCGRGVGARTSPTSSTDAHDRVHASATAQRIFNLGYYTWVEQQGTPFELFEARRSQDVLARPAPLPPVWDEMITEFNARRRGRLTRWVTVVGRLVVRGVRHARRHRRAVASGVPERHRRRSAITRCSSFSGSRRCAAATIANPFVAFRPLPRVGWRSLPRTA